MTVYELAIVNDELEKINNEAKRKMR